MDGAQMCSSLSDRGVDKAYSEDPQMDKIQETGDLKVCTQIKAPIPDPGTHYKNLNRLYEVLLLRKRGFEE